MLLSPDPLRNRESKRSPRAVPAVHLGGDPHRNGYLVYVPYLNRITSATVHTVEVRTEVKVEVWAGGPYLYLRYGPEAHTSTLGMGRRPIPRLYLGRPPITERSVHN